MKTAILIPARYASVRLPGKPLLRATGKYLIQHVYERACQARSAGCRGEPPHPLVRGRVEIQRVDAQRQVVDHLVGEA